MVGTTTTVSAAAGDGGVTPRLGTNRNLGRVG